MQLVNIGFGNIVSASRIVAIISPESAPIKRLVQEAKDNKTAVDATCGRRTRAVLIMDSGHIILSAVQPETVAGRLDKDISAMTLTQDAVGELLTKAENRYALVIATAKRARQLSLGADPLTDKKEASMVTLAADEIAEGVVQIVEDEENYYGE